VIDDDTDVTCVSLAREGLWLIAGRTLTLEQAGSTLAAIALESLYFCGSERLEDGDRRGNTGAGIVGDGAGNVTGNVNSELRAIGVEEDSKIGCSAGKKGAVRVLNWRVQDSISHGVKRRHGKDPVPYSLFQITWSCATLRGPLPPFQPPLQILCRVLQYHNVSCICSQITHEHTPPATVPLLGWYPGSAPIPSYTWTCLYSVLPPIVRGVTSLVSQVRHPP